MSLVSIADLETYMGRDLTAGEETAASPLVVSVTAELEAWLGRVIEVAEYTETDLIIYPGQAMLELTYTPVRSVETVEVDGDAVTSYAIERSGIALWGWGAPSLLATSYPVAEVTYTAGLGEPAQSVAKSIVLGRVARLLEKRAADVVGLESISVEGYSDKWLSEGFTDEELERVRRWKRRGVSVASLAPPNTSSFAGWP